MKGSVIGSVLVLATLLPAGAHANEIYFTQAKIPGRISEQGLKGFMRGHHSRAIQEEPDHKKWKFQLGVFLRREAGDLEAHLLFYDVERGREEFVSEMTVFLSDRTENTFLQPVTLERPMFKPMNRYMAALQIRRQRLARKDFELIGQRDERTGVVAFSDTETVDPEEAAARQRAQEEAARRQQEEAAISELEAREALQKQADDEAAAQDPGGEPVGTFDEYGEIPQSAAAPGTEEGGCASCTAAGPAGRAGVLAGIFAGAALLAFGRRRKARKRTPI